MRWWPEDGRVMVPSTHCRRERSWACRSDHLPSGRRRFGRPTAPRAPRPAGPARTSGRRGGPWAWRAGAVRAAVVLGGFARGGAVAGEEDDRLGARRLAGVGEQVRLPAAVHVEGQLLTVAVLHHEGDLGSLPGAADRQRDGQRRGERAAPPEGGGWDLHAAVLLDDRTAWRGAVRDLAVVRLDRDLGPADVHAL